MRDEYKFHSIGHRHRAGLGDRIQNPNEPVRARQKTELADQTPIAGIGLLVNRNSSSEVRGIDDERDRRGGVRAARMPLVNLITSPNLDPGCELYERGSDALALEQVVCAEGIGISRIAVKASVLKGEH